MITDKYTLSQKAWQETSVTIHRPDQPPLTDVAAKQSTVTLDFPQPDAPPLSWPFPILIVKSTDSQLVWAGTVNESRSANDFFIQHKRQLLYGRLDQEGIGVIEWLPNLADPVKDEISLDEAIAAFDKSDIYTKLEANYWGDGFQRQMKDKSSLRYTPLTDILGLNFWGAHGDGFTQQTGDLHLSIVKIEENIVEFDLENRSIKRKAKVWVNLDTRRVVKATINDKLVFEK